MPHKPSARELVRQAARFLAERPRRRFGLRPKLVPANAAGPERAVLVEDLPTFFRGTISPFGQLEPVEVVICDLATNPLWTIRSREFGRHMSNMDNLRAHRAKKEAEHEARLDDICQEMTEEAIHMDKLHFAMPRGDA